MNIIASSLGMDEFFRVSNCTTAKEIWDTLEIVHEGTKEVKRSKLNTLSHEYEMFTMEPGEKIVSLQKRFTHITNHLVYLGRKYSNDELNLRVLRCLTREWQPEVTTIREKKSLANLSISGLFGKLQEHELELERLTQTENKEKKHKNLSLKTESKIQDSDESNDEEDMALFVRKFGKFFRNKNLKFNQGRKRRDESTSSQRITCYGCGKRGHIKNDCPENDNKKDLKEKKDFKEKKDSRKMAKLEKHT